MSRVLDEPQGVSSQPSASRPALQQSQRIEPVEGTAQPLHKEDGEDLAITPPKHRLLNREPDVRRVWVLRDDQAPVSTLHVLLEPLGEVVEATADEVEALKRVVARDADQLAEAAVILHRRVLLVRSHPGRRQHPQAKDREEGGQLARALRLRPRASSDRSPARATPDVEGDSDIAAELAARVREVEADAVGDGADRLVVAGKKHRSPRLLLHRQQHIEELPRPQPQPFR